MKVWSILIFIVLPAFAHADLVSTGIRGESRTKIEEKIAACQDAECLAKIIEEVAKPGRGAYRDALLRMDPSVSRALSAFECSFRRDDKEVSFRADSPELDTIEALNCVGQGAVQMANDIKTLKAQLSDKYAAIFDELAREEHFFHQYVSSRCGMTFDLTCYEGSIDEFKAEIATITKQIAIAIERLAHASYAKRICREKFQSNSKCYDNPELKKIAQLIDENVPYQRFLNNARKKAAQEAKGFHSKDGMSEEERLELLKEHCSPEQIEAALSNSKMEYRGASNATAMQNLYYAGTAQVVLFMCDTLKRDMRGPSVDLLVTSALIFGKTALLFKDLMEGPLTVRIRARQKQSEIMAIFPIKIYEGIHEILQRIDEFEKAGAFEDPAELERVHDFRDFLKRFNAGPLKKNQRSKEQNLKLQDIHRAYLGMLNSVIDGESHSFQEHLCPWISYIDQRDGGMKKFPRAVANCFSEIE